MTERALRTVQASIRMKGEEPTPTLKMARLRDQSIIKVTIAIKAIKPRRLTNMDRAVVRAIKATDTTRTNSSSNNISLDLIKARTKAIKARSKAIRAKEATSNSRLKDPPNTREEDITKTRDLSIMTRTSEATSKLKEEDKKATQADNNSSHLLRGTRTNKFSTNLMGTTRIPK